LEEHKRSNCRERKAMPGAERKGMTKELLKEMNSEDAAVSHRQKHDLASESWGCDNAP
jgi:hypothetical protein